MISVTCERCGQSYPGGAGHQCPSPEASNDNPGGRSRYDEKVWRRGYMREYMARKREKERAKRGETSP